MKILKLICLFSIITFASCRTTKITSADSLPAEQTESSSEVDTETKKATPTLPTTEQKVVTKQEKVTVADAESDNLKNMRYYVIIGSFRGYENAKNYKRQLMDEGFYPGILINEEGLYRVCVDSFNEEAKARTSIANIRNKYEKYNDVWLLKQK